MAYLCGLIDMELRDWIWMMAGVAATALLFVAVLYLRRRRRERRMRRAGREGEKVAARELRRIARRSLADLFRGRSMEVVNDLLFATSAGRTVQVDHIVVSRRGIFVIETKSHLGRVTGTEFGQYWTQRREMQSRSFYNPLLQNESHIRHLRRALPSVEEGAWRSVILFTRAWEVDIKADDRVEPGRLWGERRVGRTFDPSAARKGNLWGKGAVEADPAKIVICLGSLRRVLKRGERILSREEVAEIAGKLRGMNCGGSGERKEHAGYAGRVGEGIGEKISAGECPRCGGRLEVREGSGGKFIGCSNYPGCRFTAPYDRPLGK